MKLEFSVQIFEKYSVIKFNENAFSGNRAVPWEQTDRQTHRPADRRTDGQTDMTKLIVAFLNFANVPQNCTLFWQSAFIFFLRVLGDGTTIYLYWRKENYRVETREDKSTPQKILHIGLLRHGFRKKASWKLKKISKWWLELQRMALYL